MLHVAPFATRPCSVKEDYGCACCDGGITFMTELKLALERVCLADVEKWPVLALGAVAKK